MERRELICLREALGLTQKEFAEKIGVTRATLNRWENRHHKPMKVFEKVLKRLQKSVEKKKK